MKPLLTNQSDTEILLTNATASKNTMFRTRLNLHELNSHLKTLQQVQSTKPKEVVTREKQELKLCTKIITAINFLPTSYIEYLLHRLKEANFLLPVHSWMLSTKKQYRKSA